jgi:hypothetical protein
MSFHKRYINIDTTKEYLNRGDLDELYNADAYFFNDDLSYDVYRMYLEELTDKEIKLKLNNYGQNN